MLVPKSNTSLQEIFEVGDYTNAEKHLENSLTNPDNELQVLQYWYAETYRIRQMYTDAATAYLEGYQKYQKARLLEGY